jgi:hypothetical protein
LIINPTLPSGYVIFCDDIRHEVSGKTTQVGVYNGQLILAGTLPATIPQVCAVISLRIAPPRQSVSPSIKIFQTGVEDPLFEFEVTIEAIIEDQFLSPDERKNDEFKFMQLSVNAPLQGLIITEPCQIQVRAFIGDDEIRLAALQILIADDNASETDSTR